MHTEHPQTQTSTYAPRKSRLTVLANWLVAIVTLLSVAHGLGTYDKAAPIPIWCLMGAITLLTLTIAVNRSAVATQIRMWKHFSSGGKQTCTKVSKS